MFLLCETLQTWEVRHCWPPVRVLVTGVMVWAVCVTVACVDLCVPKDGNLSSPQLARVGFGSIRRGTGTCAIAQASLPGSASIPSPQIGARQFLRRLCSAASIVWISSSNSWATYFLQFFFSFWTFRMAKACASCQVYFEWPMISEQRNAQLGQAPWLLRDNINSNKHQQSILRQSEKRETTLLFKIRKLLNLRNVSLQFCRMFLNTKINLHPMLTPHYGFPLRVAPSLDIWCFLVQTYR
jgi:hypothetical protein